MGHQKLTPEFLPSPTRPRSYRPPPPPQCWRSRPRTQPPHGAASTESRDLTDSPAPGWKRSLLFRAVSRTSRQPAAERRQRSASVPGHNHCPPQGGGEPTPPTPQGLPQARRLGIQGRRAQSRSPEASVVSSRCAGLRRSPACAARRELSPAGLGPPPVGPHHSPASPFRPHRLLPPAAPCWFFHQQEVNTLHSVITVTLNIIYGRARNHPRQEHTNAVTVKTDIPSLPDKHSDFKGFPE